MPGGPVSVEDRNDQVDPVESDQARDCQAGVTGHSGDAGALPVGGPTVGGTERGHSDRKYSDDGHSSDDGGDGHQSQ